ncbi:MAG: tryptophan 7-halogenase [Microcoleus sp. C1-bin4]|nr:tryptophan 7-halogenase [Microcoleus sp. C1-bin4]
MRLGFERGRFFKSFIWPQLGSLPVIDLCQILKQLVRHTCGEVQCDRLADGKWGLKLRTKDGCQLQVKTSFVVDASGRRSLFATWQGANKIRTDHLMGIASVFALEKEVLQDYYTLVEAAEYGWWYAARLPDNRAIVTLMSNRELLSRYGLLQPETWTAYLKQTRYVQELIHQACSQSKLLIQPAFSQYLDRMIGDRWLAVGDAACTLDPLSSAGIYKALQSGIKAALAISRYLLENKVIHALDGNEERHFFAHVPIQKF